VGGTCSRWLYSLFSPSDCLPLFHLCIFSLSISCSQEARDNISAGLRMVWKRRYQRLETQATCLFDWQNLIAEAAREGFDEEEELQWDSFEILEKQLQQEWLETPRPKTANRAPVTLEERRKISKAMAAKWADPVSSQPHHRKTIFLLSMH